MLLAPTRVCMPSTPIPELNTSVACKVSTMQVATAAFVLCTPKCGAHTYLKESGTSALKISPRVAACCLTPGPRRASQEVSRGSTPKALGSM